MTRYTKLEGRRAPLSKSTAEEAIDRKRKAREYDDDERLGAAEPSVSAAPAKAETHDEDAQGKPSAAASGEQLDADDPSKLLKRVKLLRLKAKKAKTPEKRAELEKLRKETEKRAHALNGERGANKKGKTERSENKSRNSTGYERRIAARGGEGARSFGGPAVAPNATSEIANAAPVNPWKAMEAERRANTDARNAHRRDKRAAERAAAQMCFACRQTGHAAKDCPQQSSAASSSADGGAGACCYRCGSTEHTLGKCTQPASVGLPYAQCYICNKQGHLASQCAQNGGRGIYPRGGCCKVCSSVEHLANDCPQDPKRKRGDVNEVALSGKRDAMPIGADDDDFHAEAAATQKKPRRSEEASSRSAAPAAKARKVVAF